ncbi:MAG: hypothetical protein OYL92_12130 [Acidobacteriota bacterium]|nr:hypothetical protein [Acidobacteriota bacterium]MDE3265708.1 hypothetical protein [Acidobacteriota bacterium]
MARQTNLQEELAQKVEELLAAELKHRFGSSFVFDPIRVTRKLDLDDEPYYRVEIVFDGGATEERLRELAKGVLDLMTFVEKKLREQEDAGDVFLLPSYIEKSEWDEVAAATA